jgi:beta-fructofuranosidase
LVTKQEEANQPLRVPRFTFADTLDEQEAQLAANPLLRRFAESRRAMAADPHRPGYHYVSPENRMNDPNGLCFWRGRWHLFYQGYPPEDPRVHWGHAVSEDLIHWRDLPYAIYPGPESSCFSGSTLVEEKRVIAMYHGVNVGNMATVSSDPLLLNWEKVTGHAVIPDQSRAETPAFDSVFDPCLWKKGSAYYSLSGHGRRWDRHVRRTNVLFRSADLVDWECLHEFVENDLYIMAGDDGACPYFWPIGDKYILLFFSHLSGGQYLLGDYDTGRDKFVATDAGKFNFGFACPGGVHAPSATPDGRGGVIVIFNMNQGRPATGWNQILSLPRRLTLDPSATVHSLRIEPAGDIASLRREHRGLENVTLPANREVVLEGIEGNTMELDAAVDLLDAPIIEMNVLRSPGAEERTRIVFYRKRGTKIRHEHLISIDSSQSSELPDLWPRGPETAPVRLEDGEPLHLRVFVDRSVVEVFVNGTQCVAVRVYPGRADSVGVSMRSQGRDARLRSLDAWKMETLYSAERS